MLKEKLYEAVHKQPYGTEDVIDIRLIIVPQEFRDPKSKPKKWKMVRSRNEYAERGYLDSPITVHIEDGVYHLADGYTRLLVGFEHGLKQVPVKYI